MKIFYHNDVDGLTSAEIVRLHHAKINCTLIPYDYSLPFPVECIEAQEEIWILDISFSEATKDQLYGIMCKTRNLTWIDHHLSSLELEIRSSFIYQINGYRDTRYSCAVLSWMHLHSINDFSKIPLFIRMISDSDTGKHEMPEAFELVMGLELKMSLDYSAIIQTLIKETQLSSPSKDEDILGRLINDGKAILGCKMRLAETFIQNYLSIGSIGGQEAYILNCLADIPLIAMKNLGNMTDMFVGYIFDGRSKQYVYRLYTDNPDLDCRSIAERYGGGGHRCAAGFRHNDNLIEWSGKENSYAGKNHEQIEKTVL